MKTIGYIKTTVCTLVIAFTCCFSTAYAQKNQDQEMLETEPTAGETSQKHTRSRPRKNFIKMTDFHLRNGKLVSGKLVSEDKNKVVVEQLDGSRIVVSTYSKREIDARTLHTKNVPEAKYYLNLAEYFAGRTWDFRDDPDDFIQAFRCYEKAGQLVAETQGRDLEKIEQINKKIEQLQADRQVWIRETSSRAKLKKLEFEAEIEIRIKELEDKVNASSRQIDETVEQLNKLTDDIRENISKTNKNLARQLQMLRTQIEFNRRLIDRLRWYSPYPYLPGQHTQPGNNQ